MELYRTKCIADPKLKRWIGNCIDYIIRPKITNTNPHSISHQYFLSIEHLDAWVSLPTYFNNPRIGFMQLALLELRKVSGFSPINQQVTVIMNSFPLIPLQRLSRLLQPTLPIVTNITQE